MNKEEVLFQKRIQDLAQAAFQKDKVLFTDFLSMNELSILHTMEKSFPGVRFETYGGYEFAERQMARFVPDALFYQVDYPIVLLKISPLNKKFAEELTHRDYLGALLNLGIERGKLGDIIAKEDAAYVYCHDSLADFFKKELTRIKHTIVKVEEADDLIDQELKFVEIKNTVASLRADNIVALACGQSRTSTLNLFRAQKVFINARLTESNSRLLKEGDIISVRGYGRFVFQEVISTTKKGRYYICIHKYV